MPQTKAQLTVEIKELRALQKKAMQMIRDIGGGPEIETAMRDSVLKIQRRVMRGPPGGRGGPGTTPVGYIPVDTGRLRASVTPVITSRGTMVTGVVGTNVDYAPTHEFGMGPFKALRFFRTSMEKNRRWVQKRFDRAMRQIMRKKP